MMAVKGVHYLEVTLVHDLEVPGVHYYGVELLHPKVVARRQWLELRCEERWKLGLHCLKCDWMHYGRGQRYGRGVGTG